MSLDAAYSAFTAGNLNLAEQLLTAETGTDARFLLARTLIAANRDVEAEAILASLVEATTHAKALRMLASLQYKRTAFDTCEAILERLIAIRPLIATREEFHRLTKIKRRARKADEARAIMAQAMEAFPGDVELIAAHADTLSDRRAACAELERYLETLGNVPSVRAAYVLKRIITYRGPLQREMDSLPALGLSWEDTCRWPDQEGLEYFRNMLQVVISSPGPEVSAVVDAAWAFVAQKKWDGAENLLNHVRESPIRGTLADFTYLGRAFHAGLGAVDDATLAGSLAPVHRLLDAPDRGGPILFVGSDIGYFHRFTIPFLRSLDAMAIPLDVQVHLLDGHPAAWTEAVEALNGFSSVGIGLSAEESGMETRPTAQARVYYHSVRFIRLYQEVKRAGRPMWIVDADVRILRDPRSVMDGLAGFDLALGSNPCAFEPNLKFMACCVGIAPTPRGLAYARRVAAYILHMKNTMAWDWSVDQTALFAVYALMDAAGEAPAARFLDSSAICLNDETSGAFQFPSGIHKYFSV
jgi:hypothetical protein